MAKNDTNKAPETTATKAVVVVSTTKGETKADKAREIFNQAYAKFHEDPKTVPARKDIIGRMVAEAGLTPAGAATYLQNFKRTAGLTAKK